jgi:chromosome segregation ATPase
MDSIRHQVNGLNEKIDTLYQLVENLNERMGEVLSEIKTSKAEHSEQFGGRVGERPLYNSLTRVDAALAHKDILIDSSYSDSNSGNREKELSPEIQIQRLTAQLTAAYNRIAALEEQLLSKRVY